METTVKEQKIDLTKTDKLYYKATKEPLLLELPPIHYLSLKGMGAPEGSRFKASLEAIYPVAYAVKFYHKSLGQDFVVPKLGGQWWSEEQSFEDTPREDWHWNLLIRMPDFVEKEVVEDCVATVIRKKGVKVASEIHLDTLEEGKCVQVLHKGSYEEEEKTIAKLMSFVHENGFELNGHHHEIYITDPMRTSEERLKTIIRYPVQ